MKMKYFNRVLMIAPLFLLSGCLQMQECETYPEGRRYKTITRVRNEEEKYTEHLLFLTPDFTFNIEEGETKAKALGKYINSIATALLGNGYSHYWAGRFYDDGKVPEDWRLCIVAVANHIADKNFQEREWFNSEEDAICPREMYYVLFRELGFNEFLKTPDNTLTEEQVFWGRMLKKRMGEYFKFKQ